MISQSKPKNLKIVNSAVNILIAWSILNFLIISLYAFNISIGETNVFLDFESSTSKIEESREFLFNGEKYNIPLMNKKSSINLQDLPFAFKAIISLYFVLAGFLSIIIVIRFKKFTNNIYEGDYFSYENVAILKQISYLIFGIWFLKLLPSFLQYYVLYKIEYIINSSDYQLGFSYLVVSLIVWMFSHIFKKGIELKEEQELTI